MIECHVCGFEEALPAQTCPLCGAVQPAGVAPAPVTDSPRHESRYVTLLAVLPLPELPGFDLDLLRQVMEQVRAAEGRFLRLNGAVALAAWGLPLAREGHALLAAGAALRLRELARDARLRAVTRLALHSGLVETAAVARGAALIRAEGPEIARVRMLAGLATPGTVLVTAETRHLLASHKVLRRLTLEAEEAPQGGLFELVGRADHFGLDAADAAGRDSRMVGREAELARLRATVHDLRSGRGGVVGVVGTAGLGKTRLLREVFGHDRPATLTVFGGAVPRYGAGSQLEPLRELVLRWLGVGEDESSQLIHRRAADRVEALGLADADVLAPLMGLIGHPLEPDSWDVAEPQRRRQRIAGALIELVRASATIGPVALLIDDLHWCDAQTREILDELAHEAESFGILVVMTWRPDEPGFEPPDIITELRLAPLERPEMLAFLDALMGEDPSLAPLKERIAEQGDGSPLFLEEVITYLIERGDLCGDAGAYRLCGGDAPTIVPPGVRSALQERLDRLTADQRAVIQAAAVLDRDADPAVIAGLTGRTAAAVRALLASLAAQGFLRLPPAGRRDGWQFRHRVLIDIVYDSLSAAGRRELHARAVTGLEAAWGKRARLRAETLVRHAELGGRPRELARYLSIACQMAVLRWANREALEIHRRCLAVLAELEEDQETLTWAADLRLAVTGALLPLGRKADVVTCLEEAETLAIRLAEPRRLAMITLQLCMMQWMVGAHEDALGRALRAVRMADQARDLGSRLFSRFCVGIARHGLGQYEAALAPLEEMRGLLDDGLEERQLRWFAGYPSVIARTFIASSLTYLGRLEEAWPVIETGIALAEDKRHPYTLTLIYEAFAHWHLDNGTPEEALASLQRIHALARGAEVYTMETMMAARVAMLQAATGAPAAALETLAPVFAEQQWGRCGEYVNFYAHVALSDGLAGTGRKEEAVSAIEAALALAERHREHGHAALAGARRLALAADAGGWAAGAAALARARAAGMARLVARLEGAGLS